MKTLRDSRMMTILAVALLGACAGSPSDVEDRVSLALGTYSAEGGFGAMVLTTHTADGTETTDWLALGGSFVIELREDGTTAGRLLVPGADEDGGDLDEDMAGRWSMVDDVVRFEQDADTFVRDMAFTFDGSRLLGEETFGQVTVRTVLQRR